MTLALVLVAVLGSQIQRPVPQNTARYKNLAVYPIYESLGAIQDSNYITLDEGLKSGTVTVTEKGGSTVIRRPVPRPRTPNPPTPAQQEYQGGASAEVNSLWLINKSGKRLILLTGEMVRGGQQDRIIGKDTIIPPNGQPVDLGVYCVEHGRWNGKGDFEAPSLSYGVASPRIRKSAQYNADQQTVWNGVAQGGAALKVESGSDAYRDIAGNKGVVKQVDEYVNAIDSKFPTTKATGVAIAVNGRMVWFDRFSSNDIFRKYWPKLLRSYAMEALTNQQRMPSSPPSVSDAMNFVSDRGGKTSYEVNENKVKLTKIDNKSFQILRLEDLATKPNAVVHESKVVKD